MVLFLPVDIGDGVFQLRYSDREDSVTPLPFAACAAGMIIDPFGRPGLDQLDCLGHRNRWWDMERNMNVICGSADPQRAHAVFACYAADIVPQPTEQFHGGNIQLNLYREYDMEMLRAVGVSHSHSLGGHRAVDTFKS